MVIYLGMQKYKVALFIGRFQPFHNGHWYSLTKCFELAENVIVGIGSSQESGTEANHFDFELRKRMIETLAGVTRKVEVWAIPDVFNDVKWGKMILTLLAENNYQVEEVVAVGNNEWTNRIMKQVGIDVYESGLYNRDELEGIKIRQMMKVGDERWVKRVPENIVKLLDKYGLPRKN